MAQETQIVDGVGVVEGCIFIGNLPKSDKPWRAAVLGGKHLFLSNPDYPAYWVTVDGVLMRQFGMKGNRVIWEPVP